MWRMFQYWLARRRFRRSAEAFQNLEAAEAAGRPVSFSARAAAFEEMMERFLELDRQERTP